MTTALPDGPRMAPLAQTLRWGLRPDAFMDECRARHGDAFTCRFAGLGEAVFLSDPAAARALFTAGSDDFRAAKTKFLRPILGDHSVLCLDGEAHLRQRRLLLPALHGEHLRRMRSTIEALTDREVATWPEGRSLALAPRMRRVALDVILTVVFGLHERRARDRLQALVGRLQRAGHNPLQLARLSLLRRDLAAPPHPRSGLGRLLAAIDVEILALVAERRARPRAEPDVLSMLLGARDEDDAPMSDRELRDELMTMLLAGHETTAASLAWALERLVRHPAAWDRLRTEAAATGTGPWAEAVVAEALRVRPVLWLSGRRLVRDVQVGDHALPAGTLAYVCSYLLHTRADLWPEPRRFAPERFLGPRPDAYTFIPFGGGRRRCIGAAFAEMEMRAVLSRIAARADLVAEDGRDERMVRRGYVIAPARGTRVRVRRLEGSPAPVKHDTDQQEKSRC